MSTKFLILRGRSLERIAEALELIALKLSAPGAQIAAPPAPIVEMPKAASSPDFGSFVYPAWCRRCGVVLRQPSPNMELPSCKCEEGPQLL